jgi:hypothetical protein
MSFDAHTNFGFGLVAVAPSPATTGTTFSMTNSEASLMPDPSISNYNLTVWQNNRRPAGSNAEIVRVINKGAADSGGTGYTLFTIVRQQEGTLARSITSGDFVGNNITKKWFDDIEATVTQKTRVTVGSAAGADYVCDGTADNIEIQAALDYVNTNGGGTVFIKKGTYNCTNATLTVGSNTEIVGESKAATIIKKNAAANTSVFTNKDTTNGNSFIAIRNLIVDQNGANQTTGGGGMSFTGITDSTFENVIVKRSYTFNMIVLSLAGTTLTGTVTFTNGSETVVGAGTSFTTQFSKYSIIKSAGNQFSRVLSVTDDTHLVLDRPWGWATETGVTFKNIPANARNRILNCTFEGNSNNDNVGLGLFDDSLVEGCVTHDSTGYGFGPDHANRTKFIGNTSYNNPNSGIGMETCGYCVVTDNEFYNNATGINLISGSYRNVVANNNVAGNTAKGISVTYNTASYPQANENSVMNNIVSGTTGATGDGIYVSGVDRTVISNNRVMNNARGGIVLSTASSVVSTNTYLINNYSYDNQTTKTQQYGIWIASGSNTNLLGNTVIDSDHITKGILDSGTGTIINTPSKTYTKVVSRTADADFICDGVADEVEINAAITAVNATGGGTVFLRAGTYNQSTANHILLKSNVTLVGEGVSSKIVLALNNTVKVNACNDVVIKNLCIDGSNLTGTGINAHNIYIDQSNDVMVRDCYLSNAQAYGVFTTNSGAGTTVKGFKFINNKIIGKCNNDLIGGGPGVDTANIQDVLIQGNYLRQDASLSGAGTYTNCIDMVAQQKYVISDNITYGSIVSGGEKIPHANVDIVNNVVNPASNVAADLAVGLIMVLTASNVSQAADSYNVNITGNQLSAGSIFVQGQSSTTNRTRKVNIANNIINGVKTASYAQNNYGICLNYLANVNVLGNIVDGSTNGINVTNVNELNISDNKILNCTAAYASSGTITQLSGSNNLGINPELLYSLGNITGSPTFDRANGNVQVATLTGDISPVFTPAIIPGDRMVLKIIQDATGNRNIILPNNVIATGGYISLSSAANSTSIIDMVSDGTNWNTVSSADATALHKTGNETATGDKTLSGSITRILNGAIKLVTDVTVIDQTPTMTDYFTPSGLVFATSEFDTNNNAAWHLFDKSTGTNNKWTTVSGQTTGKVGYCFDTAKSIIRYIITGPIAGQAARGPKSWTFEGSNDGITYTVLDTQTNVATWGSIEQRTYNITNKNNYRFYRLNVTANQGDALLLSIVELNLLSETAVSALDSAGNLSLSSLNPIKILDNGGAIYNVKSYGARGGTKTIFDGAMTVGSSTLTSATANFTTEDIGKVISVLGAGSQNASGGGGGAVGVYTLQSTIIGVTDSQNVTLNNNAVNTVTGQRFVYGYNDTKAIQRALDAAYNNGGGIVYIPPGDYRGANSDSVYVKSNVTLMGAGWGSTTLHLSVGIGFGVSGSSAVSCVNARVQSLKINGDHMGGNISGLSYNYTTDCWAEDVMVINIPFWSIIGAFANGQPTSPSLYFRRCIFDRGIWLNNPMAQDMTAFNYNDFVSMKDCEFRNNISGYATCLFYSIQRNVELEGMRFINCGGSDSVLNVIGDYVTVRNISCDGGVNTIHGRVVKVNDAEDFVSNGSTSGVSWYINSAAGLVSDMNTATRHNGTTAITNSSGMHVFDTYNSSSINPNYVNAANAGDTTLTFSTAPFGFQNGLKILIDVIGDGANTAVAETRTLVSGANTTVWTLDAPLVNAHAARCSIVGSYPGDITLQNSRFGTLEYACTGYSTNSTFRIRDVTVATAGDTYGWIGLPGGQSSVTQATTINLDWDHLEVLGGVGFSFFGPATNLITYKGNVRNVRVYGNSTNSWVPAGRINLAYTMQVRFENIELFTGWQVSTGTVFNNGSVFKNIRSSQTGVPLALPTGIGTTPGVPASNSALTNNTGIDATVYISGGTVTVVKVGATTTGLISPCTVRVPIGQTITLTYSVAPTWVWLAE